jgi:hypothetical protein
MAKKVEGVLSVVLVIILISFIQYSYMQETYCQSYQTTISYRMAGSDIVLCPLEVSPLEEKKINYHLHTEDQLMYPISSSYDQQSFDLHFREVRRDTQ